MIKNVKSQTVLHFKQWSRKAFAVFSSLNKTIKICSLILSYGMISTNANAQSNQDTLMVQSSYDLDEVVISANRTAELFNEVSRIVYVIPLAEIKTNPAQSIQDLLEHALSVDVRQRGANGVQADISIRGGSFDQTLILLNGIPMNDPQTGHHNLNLPISLESITRIEILEGPASRIFGPNAFSGAINIITEIQNNKTLKLNLSGGEHGLYNTSISASHPGRKTQHYLQVNTSGANGYIDNSDYSIQNVFYQGNLNTNHGKFNLQSGYLNKAFGANSFYTSAYPEQFEHIKTKFLSLSYSLKNKLKTSVYWKQHNDRFELFREDRFQENNGFYINEANDTAVFVPNVYEEWNYYSGHNYHQTNIFGFNSNVNLKSKFGVSSIGIHYKFDHIYSNVLGEKLDQEIKIANKENAFYTKSASRHSYDVFVEHAYKFKNFSFSTGALGEYTNAYGFNVIAGGEAGYYLNSSIKTMISLNQSLRLPTYTDLFYSGPSNYGNPNLKPEKAMNYEVAIKGSHNYVQWHLGSFLRRGKDVIDWVKLEGESKYTTRNYTKLITYGIETSINIMFPKNLSFSKYTENIRLSYTYISLEKEPLVYGESAYVLDHLKHKLNIQGKHFITNNIGLSWNFSFQDRNGSFTDALTGESKEYLPFGLMDLRVFLQNKSWRLYFETSNLFDKKYQDLGNLIQPGRWIKIGSSFEFNL